MPRSIPSRQTMLKAPPPQPLTDDEIDKLDDFLGAGSAPMNMEGVDGYFAALICGPVLVSPREALDVVLGSDMVFDSGEQANDIIGLLMRHWNTIATELERTLHEPHVYLPILFEDDQGATQCNDWALGFARGMATRRGSWSELLNDEAEGGCVLPVLLFAHEHDTDPEMRPPPIDDKKRGEVKMQMIAGLTRAYKYFARRRRADMASPSTTPRRRAAPKVGRNDPCPCGSGRKYKHCCATTAQ
jgi:uncharacterized protein